MSGREGLYPERVRGKDHVKSGAARGRWCLTGKNLPEDEVSRKESRSSGPEGGAVRTRERV